GRDKTPWRKTPCVACDGLKRLWGHGVPCLSYDECSAIFPRSWLMKTLNKTLLLTAMLAMPLAVAQAHDDDAAHRAWLKAQQIDIKPTLNIQETEIPAGSSGTSTGTGMPAGNKTGRASCRDRAEGSADG